MTKQIIYLAGTIYNDTPHSLWKEEFKHGLDKEYFTTHDPEPQFEAHTPDVIARDKQIITKCDILVAYINRVTFGTTMEIFYAYSFGNKPVFVIDTTDTRGLKNDLWLSGHCHKIFKNPTDASDYINEYMKKFI